MTLALALATDCSLPTNEALARDPSPAPPAATHVQSDITRTFYFGNGAEAIYSRRPGKANAIDLTYQSPEGQKQTYIDRLPLKMIEIHSTNTFEKNFATAFVKAEFLAQGAGITHGHANAFSRFAGPTGAREPYLIFQDGLLARSCVTGRADEYSLIRFVHEGQTYLLESSLQKAENSKRTRAETYLTRTQPAKGAFPISLASDFPTAECYRLDGQFYKWDALETATHEYEDVYLLPKLERRIHVKTFEPCNDVSYGGETFRVEFPELTDLAPTKKFYYAGWPKPPVIVIERKRDGRKIEIYYRPQTLKEPKTYELKDGILTLRGGLRPIDLKEFDGEYQIFLRTGAPNVVLDKENQVVDYDEAIEGLEEMVSQSERFIEEADPKVIQAIGEGIYAGKSVAVLGKQGVGKSSAVRAFAREVRLGHVPGIPRTLRLYKFDVSELESGASFVGVMDQRISMVKAAAKAYGVLFFVDEVHAMKGAGAHSTNPTDLLQKIKSQMESESLIFIGAATTAEFERIFSTDPAFSDRWKRAPIDPPSKEVVSRILKTRMESKGFAPPSDEMTQLCMNLAGDYNAMTYNPRASVNLIRDAYARLPHLGLQGQPVTAEVLKQVACSSYHVDPIHFDRVARRNKLRALELALEHRLVGQAEAKDAVIALWTSIFNHVGPKGSVHSILLAGPSGTGKTAIAKISAELLGYATTVIEMNKFGRGNPSGVNEFRREVFSALKEGPVRALVLDEFEKASIQVQEAVLQMLSEGEFVATLQNGTGGESFQEMRTHQAVFFLTTNAARDYISAHCKAKGSDGRSACNEKQLQSELEKEGISTAILSRIPRMVPMTLPDEVEYTVAIARAVEKTLAEESQKHHVQFTLFEKDRFIKKLAKRKTPTSDYRDVNKWMERTLYRGISDGLSDPAFDDESNLPETYQIYWDPRTWPKLEQTSDAPPFGMYQ